MDVRELVIAVSTHNNYYDAFMSDKDLSAKAIEYGKAKQHAIFMPINPGLCNMIMDSASILDDIDKLKNLFGVNIATKIVNAYKKYNGGGLQICDMYQLPIMNECVDIVSRDRLAGAGIKAKLPVGTSSRDIISLTISKIMSPTSEKIEPGRVLSFQQFAWYIFVNVYADNFQYPCERYHSQMSMFANNYTHSKNTLFWEYRDDESHSMMSMIHVINQSVALALSLGLEYHVLDAFDDGDNLDSRTKSALSSILEKRMTPSMYALLAYIWLSSASDDEAAYASSLLMFDGEFESIKDLLLELSHPLATEKLIEESETGDIVVCTVEDGLMKYTTILCSSSCAQDFNGDQYGILRSRAEFTTATLLKYEFSNVKKGKKMSIIDTSCPDLFSSVECDGIDEYIIRHSRNGVMMWLRCASPLYEYEIKMKSTDQAYAWLKGISCDAMPWINYLSSSNVGNDAYANLLKDMVMVTQASKACAKICDLLNKMGAHAYNFTYGAKSNMLFAIARSC